MTSHSKDQTARHHGFSDYWDFYDTKEANKRRAKERNRQRKATECSYVFILLCIAIPVLITVLFACWMLSNS